MKQCSITGRPLNIDAEVVIIPILISKDTIYHINAHDNVHPFPIAINGVYNGDRLENMFDIDTKDKKTTALLALISDVLGYKATWEDFISSEGEEVLFKDKLHYISFFACERKVFNSLLTVYLSANRFTECKLSDFNEFKIGFKEDVFKHINNMKEVIVSRKLSGNDLLPVNANYNFVITKNFKESFIDYLAEVYYLNMYLTRIGKEWSYSKDIFIDLEEEAYDPFAILN